MTDNHASALDEMCATIREAVLSASAAGVPRPRLVAEAEAALENAISDLPMSDDEIIVYALAHAVSTLTMPADGAEHRLYELCIEIGTRIGIDVPVGDEYQRAVLHRYDPERVPDYPDPDAAAEFARIQAGD